MDWFVVHTYSGYETRVKDLLEERIASSGLKPSFGDDILVPSKQVVEVHGGRKRSTNRKFYPGCVFINMDMNEDTWHLVRSTPRVLGFIGGTNKNPKPVKEQEISIIKDRIDGQVERYPFEVGEVVWITDGPFSGFSGTVEEVDSDKTKLQVSVSILGRATAVEIDFSQVQKN